MGRMGSAEAMVMAVLLGVVCTVVMQQKGVEAAPWEDPVHALPGQPYPVPFKQNAGYVTVDATAGRAFFYYFVEAETNAPTRPVTLWLNGGPGCSSIVGGGFQEMGPFYVNKPGTALYKNVYSWNKVSNMLFLESPAGVGWSYSNTSSDYSTNDEKTAADAMTFLLKWFTEKFPEYVQNEFYITGESYAGHYVPQLAALVVDNNNATLNPNCTKLNLKAIAIGNPLFDLYEDRGRSQIETLWSHGLVSEANYETIKTECFFDPNIHASAVCNDAFLRAISNESQTVITNPYLNAYDITADTCDTSTASAMLSQQHTKALFPGVDSSNYHFNMDSFYGSLNSDPCSFLNTTLYLSQPSVQAALHANTTNLTFPYGRCTTLGSFNYSISSQYTLIVPVLKQLYLAGLRILAYSGDQDTVLSLIGTRKEIGALASNLSLTPSAYAPWYQGGQTSGWAQTYGPGNKLTFATVKGASHLVPQSSPARAFQIFKSFLAAADLPSTAADS